MANNTLVSIVMSSYNHKAYISEAVAAICKQSYSNIELIIVDDGSTDGSCDLLKKLGSTDSRINVFYKANGGPSSAFNYGIEKCRGEFIAITASDDVYYQNKIEMQLKEFKANPNLSAVFSYVDFINDSSVKINTPEYLKSVFNIENQSASKHLLNFLQFGNTLNASSALFPAALFKKIGKFHLASVQLQDFDFYFRCFNVGNVKIIEKPLLKYRVLDNNKNLSSSKHNIRTQNEMYFILPNLLESIHKNCNRIDIIDIINFNTKNNNMPYLESLPKYELIYLLCSTFQNNLIIPIVATQFISKYISDTNALSAYTKNIFYNNMNNDNYNQNTKLQQFHILKSENNGLKNEVKYLKNSLSWKLTKPIRWFKRTFMK